MAALGAVRDVGAQGVSDFGATAPVPGASDISQLTGGHDNGGSYYVDSGNPGQSVTMGANPQGYSLLNIYIKTRSSGAGGGQPGLSAYTLRIYSMSSAGATATATLITTYVTTNTATFTQGDWFKFNGLTNVFAANGIYGFALSRNGSGYWEPDNSASSVYAGGIASKFPTSSGALATTFASSDMTFDMNLIPFSDPLLTPTVIAPANLVYAGTVVTLSASYSGTAPFTSFIWQSDGQSGGTTWTNLPGSTTNIYSLNTTGMAAGTYQFHLVVTGAAGTTTNAAASMTLNNASGPIVNADTALTPSTIYNSGSTVMSATFAGTLPIYYQWQYSNGAAAYLISGATGSSYTLSNVQFTNAGYYSLIASNNPGGIPTLNTSTPALLTVTPQVILSDLGGTTPTPGAYDIAQFTTNGNTGAPESTAPLNNYYDNNGTPCGQTFTTGTNANGYSVNSINIKYGTVNGAHGAGLSYTLRLYSISGTTATLIGAYPNQNTAPAFALGDWTSWTGGITNILLANTTYAYTFAGPSFEQMGCASNNPYAGGNICAIPAAGGTATLGASGNFDATFDINLSLVSPPPTAPFVVLGTSINPSSTVAGYPVTMSAGIGGSTPLSYQWQYSDGATFTNNIVGATNGSYTIIEVQTTNTGYYQVAATNSVGSINSGFASLTVSPLTDVEIINYGGSAPSASGFDIAQLSTAGNQKFPAGLNYYDDSGAGETFTTGSNVYGYLLNELYIDMGSIEGGHVAGVTYTLRIYSVAAGNASLISTYVNNNTAPAIGTGAWTKWIGLTNILAPNTTYAYTISANGGYLQVGNATPNPYAGGQVCLIPAAGGTVNFGSDNNEDATFLVHLTAGPVVPDFGPTLTANTTITPSGVLAGGSVTMGASFTGIPLPTYQWMFNNGGGAVPIAGATGNTYTISNAQLTNSGAYYLVASNRPNGSPSTLASSPASLIVGLPAQTNTTQATVFDASSSAPTPGAYDISQLTIAIPSVVSNLNYYVNNATPPGQTFTTGNTPPTPAGYPLSLLYVNQELSSIGGGGSGSQNYKLNIYRMYGSNAVLLTSYTSANTLAVTDGDWIQWFGLTNVLATNTTYAFSMQSTAGYWKLASDSSALSPDSQGDVYTSGQSVSLPSSGIGAVIYSTDPQVDAAFLIGMTPLTAPSEAVTMTINPSSININQGPVVMTAAFVGSLPISYQWKHAGTNIPGATTTTFTIPEVSVANQGTYVCLASNSYSAGTPTPSTAQTLTVVPTVQSPLISPTTRNGSFELVAGVAGTGKVNFSTGAVNNWSTWPAYPNSGDTGADADPGAATDGTRTAFLQGNSGIYNNAGEFIAVGDVYTYTWDWVLAGRGAATAQLGYLNGTNVVLLSGSDSSAPGGTGPMLGLGNSYTVLPGDPAIGHQVVMTVYAPNGANYPEVDNFVLNLFPPGSVATNPTNIVSSVSGNQLTLSWPTDHTGWRLQVQTNSSTVGLSSNWVTVPGSTSVNSVTATINPTNGAVFYRMVFP